MTAPSGLASCVPQETFSSLPAIWPLEHPRAPALATIQPQIPGLPFQLDLHLPSLWLRSCFAFCLGWILHKTLSWVKEKMHALLQAPHKSPGRNKPEVHLVQQPVLQRGQTRKLGKQGTKAVALPPLHCVPSLAHCAGDSFRS